VVVGVGNIYAAEALFRAGIRPNGVARSITRARCEALVDAIQAVLAAAIRAGGSTISDFRQAGGDAGYFQHDFRVYGREGEPCRVCSTPLVGDVIGGRASVWCRRCQR
jgi:formamidopyrimidine-DNA glycosylase